MSFESGESLDARGDAVMKQACEKAQARLHEDTRPTLFDDSNIVRHDKGSAKFDPDSKDGDICLMNHQDAMQYAKEQGGRLPTTRDIAMYMNPKALLEERQVDPNNVPEGYYKVAGINDGKPDVFYFNNKMDGSRKLTGEIAKHAFWNSTLALGAEDYAHVFYGSLGGGGGEKDDHLRSVRHAVICIRARGKASE